MVETRSTGAIDKKLGQRVRGRRLEIAMSQERLAELLGVTFQQVQKYEKGVNRIAASRLVVIARALDVPVCVFFEGMEHSDRVGARAPSDLSKALATAGAAELLRHYASITSARVRRRLLELVRAMEDEGD